MDAPLLARSAPPSRCPGCKRPQVLAGGGARQQRARRPQPGLHLPAHRRLPCRREACVGLAHVLLQCRSRSMAAPKRRSRSPVRQVHADRPHRRRRHGRDLPRAPGGPRGLREDHRHQAHPAAPVEAAELREDVPQRGQAGRAAEPPEHRADLRPREDQRVVLHRHGVHLRARHAAHHPQGRRPGDPVPHGVRAEDRLARCARGCTTRTRRPTSTATR